MLRVHLLVVTSLLALSSIGRADPVETEAAARALMNRWLESQNEGDFATYESLYAKRFTGVRRSGPRTVRLDRAGWMKDRSRMFQRAMTVSAKDLRFTFAGNTVRATFAQTFQSGNFSDGGPKQMMLVLDEGELKIGREEMLRSVIARRGGDIDFAFVVAGGVVLSSTPDEKWARGKPRVESPDDPMVVVRAVDPKLLPDALSAWAQRKVRLFDGEGRACETRVQGFKLVGRVVPHFGTRQDWRNESEATIAQQAWALSEGSHVLVGVVQPVCRRARWARDADRPLQPVVFPEAADKKVRDLALVELRKLPAYEDLQRSFAKDFRGKGRWEEWHGRIPDVMVFRTARRGKPLMLVSASASAFEGCSEFGGSLWALWELVGDRLILRNDPGDAVTWPAAAVDLDGDGEVEILFERPPKGDTSDNSTERGWLKFQNGKYEPQDTLSIPYLDCPC